MTCPFYGFAHAVHLSKLATDMGQTLGRRGKVPLAHDRDSAQTARSELSTNTPITEVWRKNANFRTTLRTCTDSYM